jgi:hypothetical protein
VRNLFGSPPTTANNCKQRALKCERGGRRAAPGELLASPLQRGISHNTARPRRTYVFRRLPSPLYTCTYTCARTRTCTAPDSQAPGDRQSPHGRPLQTSYCTHARCGGCGTANINTTTSSLPTSSRPRARIREWSSSRCPRRFTRFQTRTSARSCGSASGSPVSCLWSSDIATAWATAVRGAPHGR